MNRSSNACLAAMLILSGCATGVVHRPVSRSVVTVPAPIAGWKGALRPIDRARVEALAANWTRALASGQGYKSRIAAEGPLLDAAIALPAVALPPGPYRCRLVRLGGKRGFASYAPDFCYVEARAQGPGSEPGLSFDKQTGSTRFEGWLLPDSNTRMGFTGSLRTRPSVAAPGYGRNPQADVVAVIERVAPFRWRMVLTRSGGNALLDIYELVPVTPAVRGAGVVVPAHS